MSFAPGETIQCIDTTSTNNSDEPCPCITTTRTRLNTVLRGNTSNPLMRSAQVLDFNVATNRSKDAINFVKGFKHCVNDINLAMNEQSKRKETTWAPFGRTTISTTVGKEASEKNKMLTPRPLIVGYEPVRAYINGSPLPSIAKQSGTPKAQQRGFEGTRCDNTDVDLWPGVAQWMISLENKTPSKTNEYFLCASNVSLGASAGKKRNIIEGVKIRVYGKDTYDSLMNIMGTVSKHLLDCPLVREEILSINADQFDVCPCVTNLLYETSKFRNNSKDCCTISPLESFGKRGTHIFFCSDMLMKYTNQFWYVSKLMINGHGKSAVEVFILRDELFGNEIRHYFSTPICMVPFVFRLNPSRQPLVGRFLLQANTHPLNNLEGNTIPNMQHPLLLVPDDTKRLMKDVPYQATGEVFPGLNLTVAFVSMGAYTAEDAFLMSESAANMFTYKKGIWVTVPFASGSKYVAGSMIPPCVHEFWPMPCIGNVKHSFVTLDNKVRLYIKRECHATNGDKFTTIHEQTGVATILPNAEMPLLYEDSGRLVDFVMSPASVFKRGTPGQVLEATVNFNYLIKCEGSPTDMLSESEITQDLYRPVTRECVMLSPGNSGHLDTTSCSIGVIRVMQSVLMCHDKIYTNKSLCGPNKSILAEAAVLGEPWSVRVSLSF